MLPSIETLFTRDAGSTAGPDKHLVLTSMALRRVVCGSDMFPLWRKLNDFIRCVRPNLLTCVKTECLLISNTRPKRAAGHRTDMTSLMHVCGTITFIQESLRKLADFWIKLTYFFVLNQVNTCSVVPIELQKIHGLQICWWNHIRILYCTHYNKKWLSFSDAKSLALATSFPVHARDFHNKGLGTTKHQRCNSLRHFRSRSGLSQKSLNTTKHQHCNKTPIHPFIIFSRFFLLLFIN